MCIENRVSIPYGLGNILKAFGVKAVPAHRCEVQEHGGGIVIWDHLTLQFFSPDKFVSTELSGNRPKWTWVFETAKHHNAKLSFNFDTSDSAFPIAHLHSRKKIPFFGTVEVFTDF